MSALEMSWTIRLLSLATLTMPLLSQGTAEWSLRGLRLDLSCCDKLERLDPSSGAAISSWNYSGVFHHALTVHGDRAVSIRNSSPTHLVSTMHPASGACTEVPLVGIPTLSGIHSLLSDPASNTLYLATHSVLYRLNPSTGQGTFVALFHPFAVLVGIRELDGDGAGRHGVRHRS